jgi:hypothetical protein
MLVAENVTLWTLGLSGDAVECVASAHPLGLELQYLINNRLLMSRVFDSWDRLSSQAQVWRDGLELRGWSEFPQGRFHSTATDRFNGRYSKQLSH